MLEQIISAAIEASATLLAALLAVGWGLKQYRDQQRQNIQDAALASRELELDLAREQRDSELAREQKSFKIQFDVDCRFFRLGGRGLVIEAVLIVSNQGSVEQRIFNADPYPPNYRGLQLLIRALDEGQEFPVVGPHQQLKFTRHIYKGNIIPENLRFYFIRPGVRQAITHVVYVPEQDISRLVQVSGRFYYDLTTPHMASRVFAVPGA